VSLSPRPVATIASDAPFNCAGDSHPGLVRSNNEDLFHLDKQRGIFLVVDGVGGQAAGETAADTAVRALRKVLEDPSDAPAPDRIRRAILRANSDILRLSRAKPELAGMACVLTVALLDGERLTAGHVGDTRLYKLRAGAISKLTRDHAPVGEREDRGELSEAEAMSHPRRNEVFRDVGSEERAANDDAFIDLVETSFERDSALVLCSDGLTDLVASADINGIVLANRGSPYNVVQALISAALSAGGKDNVTVVYVEGLAFPSAASLGPGGTVGTVSDTTPAAGAAPALWPAAPVSAPPSRASRGRRFVRAAARVIATAAAIGIIGVAAFDLWQRNWHAPAGEARFSNGRPAYHTLRVGKAAADEFRSIQDAINAAQPGDRVSVGPGEYAEAIDLKNGVTILSHPRREAVIVGPLPGPGAQGLSARSLQSGRVEGFQFVGTTEAPLAVGITVENSRDIELVDLDITGTTTAGIEIRGASHALISGSVVHDNHHVGIIVHEPASVTLLHSVIAENRTGSERAGLELAGHVDASLFGNLFVRYGSPGVLGTIDEKALKDNDNELIDRREGIAKPPGRARARRQ
jgi:serine/threonine protein phosphatase PrpC